MISGAELPSEVVTLILFRLDEEQPLADASLVCKAWRTLAFPIIWSRIHVTSDHFYKILVRIEQEDQQSFFCLSKHVRSLSVPCALLLYQDEEMKRLLSSIPKFHGLQHLTLKLYPEISRSHVLEEFRQRCPQLRSIDLEFPEHGFDISDILTASTFDSHGLDCPLTRVSTRLHQLRGFTNMKHLTISTFTNYRQPVLGASSCDTIVDVINSFPNLIALNLCLYFPSHTSPIFDEDWLSDKHFGCLINNLSFLNDVRLSGSIQVDWAAFTTRRAYHSLYSFFQRHPHIRTLSLDWLHIYQPDVFWSTNLVEELFPSLKCLTGPGELCITTIRSALAAQLEQLDITAEHDRGRLGGGDALEALTSTTSVVLSPMPRLLKLVYNDEAWNAFVPTCLNLRALGRLLEAAPALTSITTRHHMEHPVEFIELLRNVPALLVLNIDSRPLGFDNSEEQALLHFKEFSEQLKKICTGLCTVGVELAGRNRPIWGFARLPHECMGNPRILLTSSGS